MNRIVLVRYGAIPEVARFLIPNDLSFTRGDAVVVQTHRGVELGTYLGPVGRPAATGDAETEVESAVLRSASSDDMARARQWRQTCEAEFDAWRERIETWKLKLELIDLERTLDGEKLILYVLNDRGPECTQLALQAAAAGLGLVEVQPVGVEGLLPVQSSGGGCGSGGCGSGGCSS